MYEFTDSSLALENVLTARFDPLSDEELQRHRFPYLRPICTPRCEYSAVNPIVLSGRRYHHWQRTRPLPDQQ
jgi:hypothetical protein